MASFSSASSSDHHHLHHPLQHQRHPGGGGGIPAPPPPTPSNQNLSPSATAADMALSHFLGQLTSPALSIPPLPSRLSSLGTLKPRRVPTPPAISLVQPQEALLKSAASELGFFHLTDHGVPSHLPAEAHLECQPLFRTHHRDLSPLGFDFNAAGGGGGRDDDEDSSFLVFDMTAAANQGLPPALWQYALHLEELVMEVVEMLSRAGGFCNPFRGEASKPRSLMWISPTTKCGDEHADGGGGRGSDGVSDGATGTPPWGPCYPYVVCLQYEMKSWCRCLLLDDDPSWITVEPHADSVLVAIGDIAQVWSDGGFKKVRGRPMPAIHGGDGSCLTISVLVTLSTDSAISPLPPAGEDGACDEEGCGGSNKFFTFPFEEYAWRLFHEQFPLTDTLRRYRL